MAQSLDLNCIQCQITQMQPTGFLDLVHGQILNSHCLSTESNHASIHIIDLLKFTI